MYSRGPLTGTVMFRVTNPCFWIRFLATPAGIDWVNQRQWIAPQLLQWQNELSTKYVQQLDTALAAALHEQRPPARFGGWWSRNHEDDYIFE